ncbi:MAG TPA: uroporphyrinogen-III synthase [Stenomitos sp.]
MTRPREQAAELTAGLQALGAEVVHLPLISIFPPEDWTPLDRALSALSSYDWVALTSANAVEAVFERLHALGVAVPPVRWAVVGRRTGEVLRAKGAIPEVTAEPATAECLAERLLERGVAGQRVLFPRGDRAREVLPQLLREAQAEVEAPVAYRTLSAENRDLRALLPGVAWITLTSPSTWHELCKALGSEPLPAHVRLAAIGPTTAAAVQESGHEVACVAEPPGVKGLLDAMVRSTSR